MHETSAYEALFVMMGLQFHEAVTGWLTSQAIFRAGLALAFAATVFMYILGYLGVLAPGVFSVRGVTATRLVGAVIGLFIGVSILQVGAGVAPTSMAGVPWADNPYVVSKVPSIKESYRVSLLFRLLSGSAEELARGLGFLVDKTFSKTNSQMTAPNLFYKAVLGAAADTIEDPQLKYNLNLYTEECLSKALPNFDPSRDYSVLDDFFSSSGKADDLLAQIPVGSKSDGPTESCLQLKQYMNDALSQYAVAHSAVYGTVAASNAQFGQFLSGASPNYRNYVTSTMLMNQYLDQSQNSLAMEKGTELPGVAGRIAQYTSRNFVDGILSLLGRQDLQGVTLAAARSQELSDHLARAPQMAGFLKMLLIGFFPILVFPLATGRFKPLIWWWLAYLSICLWTPIWALLYHTMSALVMTQETLQAFGKLSDGLSLYAASLISSRMYQTFAVYSYLQLAIGPTFSMGLLWFMRGSLTDTGRSPIPETPGTALSALSTAKSAASTAGAVVTGVAEVF